VLACVRCKGRACCTVLGTGTWEQPGGAGADGLTPLYVSASKLSPCPHRCSAAATGHAFAEGCLLPCWLQAAAAAGRRQGRRGAPGAAPAQGPQAPVCGAAHRAGHGGEVRGRAVSWLGRRLIYCWPVLWSPGRWGLEPGGARRRAGCAVGSAVVEGGRTQSVGISPPSCHPRSIKSVWCRRERLLRKDTDRDRDERPKDRSRERGERSRERGERERSRRAAGWDLNPLSCIAARAFCSAPFPACQWCTRACAGCCWL
jgi:hypothetical protein